MQLDVLHLSNYLFQQLQQLAAGQTFWLGIAGPPGSGKSTLAAQLLDHLGGEVAIVIPMDGYHYYRRELDAMPDPAEARRRRGAPFTFNAGKFTADLQSAKERGSGRFPSFDHGIGDPVEGAIVLSPTHRIVMIEGNYLLLNQSPWCDLRPVFDETWYLDVPLDTCKERVFQRHIVTGKDEATARIRVETNDGFNAELVAEESPPNATKILTVH